VKALILHQHFNTPTTGGALRSYFLARALVESGMEVVVITAHEGAYEKKLVEGMEVHYLPIAYQNSFGFYKRSWAFVKFIIQSVRISSQIHNTSICYAISTPLTVGIAGILIKWRKRIPLLFETGDLWPDAPIELGIIKNPLLKIILRIAERFIYGQSKTVVALSVSMKALLEKRTATPVVLLPNMADTDFFKPEEKKKELVEKFYCHGKFMVSYIGSVGYANGLDSFLDCARAAQKANMPLLFLLCGEGAMLSHLKQTAQRLSIDTLKFIDFQNREGVREVMNVTDAVFISYRHHAILETGSPNKYFDGLAAGKLIVTNFGGWIQEEIEREQCGFSFNAQHPENFLRQLSAYLSDAEKMKAAQSQSIALAKKYERTLIGETFVRLMQRTS
jgi:glycosyltransferase involved in cell wall biosynthesis